MAAEKKESGVEPPQSKGKAREFTQLAPPRVLLLLTEFSSWIFSRSWSYSVQFGLEEGLAANGVQFTTIVSPFQSRAPEICPPGRFDQVWVEIVHNQAICPRWLEWLHGVAPVRVGLIAESLSYTPEAINRYPHLSQRKKLIWDRLPHFTHVLVLDEVDAAEITAGSGPRAMWWPQAVPRRYADERDRGPTIPFATFCGTPYGERAHWVRHPAVRPLLRLQQRPEAGTLYPLAFDALYRSMQVPALVGPARTSAMAHAAYLRLMRSLRRSCYRMWMKSLRAASAVVNLPHLVMAYPGRVVEAIAVGRPVIAWEVPDRPRTRELFEDGKEILLYRGSEREELAECVRRVLTDRGLAERVVEGARKKLLAYHTMEARVRQVLTWIESGANVEYE
jgi:hypothetical protein